MYSLWNFRMNVPLTGKGSAGPLRRLRSTMVEAAERTVVPGITDHELSSTGYEEELQSWASYSWNLASRFGHGALKVVYFLGEKLAYGFGITTPDWQYAIDIHEDMEREEREEREEEEKAMKKQREEVLKTLKAMEENSSNRTHTP